MASAMLATCNRGKRASPGEGEGATGMTVDAGNGGQVEGKRNRKTKEEDLLMLLAKLVLSNARELAVVKSAVITTLLMNKAQFDPVALAVKETMKGYDAMTKELPEGQKGDLGSPHLIVWHQLIASTAAMAIEDGKTRPLLKEELKTLQDYDAEIGKRVQKLLEEKVVLGLPNLTDSEALKMLTGEEILVCRVGRPWNIKLSKLEMAARPNTAAEPVVAAMIRIHKVLCSAQFKSGPAPKGELERLIGKIIGDGKGKGKGK
jgi:hypothetical protein